MTTLCKTTVTLLLTHCSYYSVALHHRYMQTPTLSILFQDFKFEKHKHDVEKNYGRKYRILTWSLRNRYCIIRTCPWNGHWTRGPFYWCRLTLIPTCISHYIHYKVCDKITYPFPRFTDHVITYPCWDLSQSMLVKEAPSYQNPVPHHEPMHWQTLILELCTQCHSYCHYIICSTIHNKYQ